MPFLPLRLCLPFHALVMSITVKNDARRPVENRRELLGNTEKHKITRRPPFPYARLRKEKMPFNPGTLFGFAIAMVGTPRQRQPHVSVHVNVKLRERHREVAMVYSTRCTDIMCRSEREKPKQSTSKTETPGA